MLIGCMRMGRTKSYKSLSGNRITHFDEHGNKIGTSYKSASGKRITHFDAQGNKTGTSWQNDYGRVRHYDSTGAKTGTSYVRPSGVVHHFDENGGKIGTSYQNFMGGYVTPSEVTQRSTGRPAQRKPQSSEMDSDTGCGIAVFFFLCFITLLFILFD